MHYCKYSVIVGFKNRGFARLEYFLRSLEIQTIKDFELIIVDYGSDYSLKESIDNIKFGFPVTYIYTETSGLLWNRAACLNVGLVRAKGGIAIIADVDLFLNDHFFNFMEDIEFQNSLYTFNCYYLTEKFNLKRLLQADNLLIEVDNDIEKIDYVGLVAVSMEALKAINYFDEYYMIWGAEDDDLYKRLKLGGFEKKHIDVKQVHIYHQWHSTNRSNYPGAWYLTMCNAYLRDGKVNNGNVGMVKTIEQRPALAIFLKGIGLVEQQLELYYEKQLIFYKFYNDFFEATRYSVFKFEYELQTNSSIKMIDQIKVLLGRPGSFIRGIEGRVNDNQKFKLVADFVEFFICTNINFIEDYYYSRTDNKIALILIRG